MRSARLISGLIGMAACLAAQQLGPASQPADPRANSDASARSSESNQTPAAPRVNASGVYLGSVPQGQASPRVLDLSLADAVQRGLRQNLGVITGGEQEQLTRVTRLRALNALLPNVSARATDTLQQVNLAAFGFPGFPGVSQVVGPFNVVDARAYVSQNVLNLSAIENRRAARSSSEAARFAVQDARDQVVLVVVNLYLQAITAASNAQSAQAQLDTATALFQLASDQRQAGVVAGIDVLRAQVEQQAEQQRVIQTRNDAEKAKLTLARAIGLPPGQRFQLTDTVPYAPFETLSLETAILQALSNRADLQSAQASLRAAEQSKRAAEAERLPSVTLDANYGAIGRRINQAHGTFAVVGGVNVPLFPGTRVRADIEEAESQIRLRRAEYEDLRASVENDIRTAYLDLQATGEQVKVAQSAVGVARQSLTQSRDRFAAGVTNNIEVVQAQEALRQAENNLINSLYSFNLAKASLARSAGRAEEGIKQSFSGK